MLQDHANLAVLLFTLHRLDGDRSEEHRNHTGTSQLFFFVQLTKAATWAALARVLAQTGKLATPRVLYTYGRVGVDYLTGAAAAASSPRAAVGGNRARTSPVTSLLCYGDLTPQKPSLMYYVSLHSLTTLTRNSYRSFMNL